MSLSLIQLRVFVTAAQCGSFTAAAKELHMSQPTVSETIRRIEQQYGTPLFVRGARRLTLTAPGEELLPLAQQTLASADGADRALKAVTGLQGGVASIGLLRNAKHYAMADLLTSFHARYPNVRLRVIGVNSADVADLVRDGGLEAGLVVLPVDTSDLSVTPLLKDEVVFATSYEWRTGPVSIDDMVEAKLVLYDAHAGWRDPTRRQLAERALLRGLVIEPQIEVEQVDTALELVASGAGETIVSRAVASSAIAPPGIRYLPLEEPLYDTVALIQRESAILSPATKELARLARETLATWK
ncbi:LysR family transcriptional regulator [Mycolicibacterium obuense]|uniref:Probable hydrogen peroxide-inducible genes activator n=1 Tax=Mycolicibacterium obuense TaxID=1807 RepID=A0A0J6Z9L8_9MYCO|nr:LysR family transcriptional regulator [Mycolicibacterium obuense]KMO81336.1 HTH-type transcriptional regulator CynR [Mycolicibacterium obuense]